MPKRELNVDFSRIIAAIFAIMLHVLGQGGILKNASPAGSVYWVAWFLEICVFCAVNCFALVSGYVMVDKQIKVKRIIGLWFQMLFYSLSLTAVYFVVSPEGRSIKGFIAAVLPVVGNQWWYMSSYFALFFLIPFLNTAIHHISQAFYQKLLAAILLGICVVDCVVPIDAFAIKDGYSAAWLVVVYLFGAYIRKYDVKKHFTATRSMLGFFCMVALTFASKVVIHFLSKAVFGAAKFDNLFISYTSITILLSAIFLFLFCLQIKIGGFGAKLIGFLSPVTLGTYLIHVHPLVFDFVLKNAFVPLAHKSLIVVLLGTIAATFVIFTACAVIELLRIQLFKLLKISKLCEKIDAIIHKLYQKIFSKTEALL